MVNIKRHGVLIKPGMLPGKDGDNINGASVIKVPDWIEDPLGSHYMYFAHHGGKYIRFAYADNSRGPFTVVDAGCLDIEDCPLIKSHIASPDVHVDNENQKIEMFFHGVSKAYKDQRSYRALSDDGLSFTPTGSDLGDSYFRVFNYGGKRYAIAKQKLYVSEDGGATFSYSHNIYTNTKKHIRHCALRIKNTNTLQVYYSRIGDKPEHIMRGDIDLTQEVSSWRVGTSKTILKPEKDYEGHNLKLTVSESGPIDGAERALRDPAIFIVSSDELRLYYSVKGEKGIAVATIKE